MMEGPLKLSKSAKKRVNQKRRQEAAKSQELGQSAQVQQEADSVFNKPAEQHPCPDLTTVPVSSEGASFLLEEAPQTSSASDQAPLETSTSDNHPNPVETTIVEALQVQSTQEAMEADSGKKVEVVKTKEEILRERQEKKAAKNAKKANSAPAKKENQPVETPKEVAGKADEVGKSKAEQRKEGRAKQEAQRAAKAEGKPATQQKPIQAKRVPDQIQADRPSVEKKLAKRLASQQVPQLPTVQRKVQLFSHLKQQERKSSIGLLTKDMSVNQENIHPAIVRLGLQYATGVVSGSNARAVALLTALKQVIADYTTPEHKELSRDLDLRLKPCINFLDACRQKSVSMGNAIRHVKRLITNTPANLTDAQAKENLYEMIDKYIHENVELAGKAISAEAGRKIECGNVILTYGYSSLLQQVLLDAHAAGKRFTVVVLDGRPDCDGVQLLRRLAAAGIPASYMLISAASYIMPEVSKVMLGAHALLANGNVMSRTGASQVALVARAHNVPVLVCCETYKFCERVQTDSFVFNELGDPDDLLTCQRDPAGSPIARWRDMDKLFLLNLKYDVTPADLVTNVITELGILPCTSVPVVLRLKHADAN